MTDAELFDLCQKIVNGRPDARDPLFTLLKAMGGGEVAWADITGKPAVIAAGADQAAARTAIGAGTSSLALGTTGSTALAGNTPKLSANAITAIAALNGSSTAANIVTALQTT